MAKQVSFKVSRMNGPSVVVEFMEPESLDDPRWDEIVTSRDDINSLALKAHRVTLQAGARDYLDDGQEAVQKYVTSYKYKEGGRGGARPRPKLTANQVKEAKFTKAQLELLKAAGMSVEQLESA